MKKYYTSGLLLAALAAMPAMAQQTVYQFPAFGSVASKTASTQVQMPWKAPKAIDDKSKGVLIYAGETADAQKLRGLVKFNSNDAYYSMERVRAFFPEELNQIRGQRFGAWDGEKYHTMHTRIYTYWEYPDFYGVMNLKNGEITDSTRVWKNWIDTPWVDDTSSDKSNLPGYYDMAWNAAEGQMYMLGANYETAGRAYTELFTIDEAGNIEDVTTLDAIYYNFTFDYYGNMYAVRPLGDKDGKVIGTELVKFNQDFEPESSIELTKDGSGIIQGTYGALGFDYSTGDLYWNVITSPYGYAYINRLPTDFSGKKVEVEYLSGVMTGNQFNGFYIPYLTADTRKSAGRVASIDAVPFANGTKADTVKWTNPTMAWDRSDLADLAEVRIYRKKTSSTLDVEGATTKQLLAADNAELVATVSASGKKGEPMSWIDNTPNTGINTYYVVPCRVSGEVGVPDSVRCFIGVDVPAVVRNAKATKLSDTSIKLDWEAPLYGHDNGYINADELKYTITRLPDHKVVAQDIAETSFTDNTIDEDNVYTYRIQASTSAGKGDVLTTDGVRAGVGANVPQYMNLYDADEANRWYSSGSAQFNYTGAEDYMGYQVWSGSSGSDMWAYSPALRLQKGKQYRFAYSVMDKYTKVEFNYYTHITSAPSSDAVVQDLRSEEVLYATTNNNIRDYEDLFTAPEDGTYHFALNIKDEGSNVYTLRSLNVTEVKDNDLGAVSLNIGRDAVVDYDNKVSVTVRNFGSKDVEANSYILRIYCNTGHGLAQVGYQKWVPAIKANGSAVVDMTFIPKWEGTYNFLAKVELAGDGFADNDFSDEVAIKCVDGSVPYTNVVTNAQTEATDTHSPFMFYGAYDTSMSLYYPEEINAPQGAKILRIGYEYTGQGFKATTEEMPVKIWMKNTDQRETAQGAISTDGMTLVYDGYATFGPGEGQTLSFDLDEPFEYDNTKSLCIVASREGARDENIDMFAALYRVFNSGTGVHRSLAYSGTTAYAGSSLYPEDPVPVLSMAFDKYTGISNATTGVTVVSANAPVYNLNGQYVGNSTKLLRQGVYIQNGKKIVVK